MGGSLRISADTETTSSQEAVSSESSSTMEDPTTTSAEAAPSTTSETSPDSTEALTSIEVLSEEEAENATIIIRNVELLKVLAVRVCDCLYT